jgi:hypothetical protein
MATFATVGGITATFAFRDAKGVSSKTHVMLPAAVTLAQATSYCDNLGTDLEAASDAKLTGYTINQGRAATASTGAVAGSRVEDKGWIEMATAAGKMSTLAIPAIKLAALMLNGRDIDLTAALITNITTQLITGNGTTAPVDSNASDLSGIVAGALKQRKGLMYR